MIPREYAWLGIIVALLTGLFWFGVHERGVEKKKLLDEAQQERQALVDRYTATEKTWRIKTQAAGDRADAAEKRLADAATVTPTVRVVRESCPIARAPTAVPEARPGAAEVPATPAAGGVLPEASTAGTSESGVYDAGPALRADAVKCDAMSVQLNYWIDRYQATQSEKPTAMRWDQEFLKRFDTGCPTAIFDAPGGVLRQCR